MNTYEITFTRENGSTGKDRITAANEKQARKDFREIHRHSSATITDVIVAAENVPASKQQERDALDQIRAIVDTLGPDSYLATAFAGCFEDAEENIKNDFACSMKQRLESAEAKRIEAELGYNRLVDKLAASEKALEAARADIEKKDEEIAALNARISAIQRPTEPAEISDELLADGGDDELSPYVYDGSMTLADREKMQQAREAFEKLADALREIAAKLAEALKPVINVVLSALKKLWKVSAKAIGVPPKWLHLAAHAKKARTRKKYRNRIRRYVFEALAAEGGGGP